MIKFFLRCYNINENRKIIKKIFNDLKDLRNSAFLFSGSKLFLLSLKIIEYGKKKKE